MPSSGSKNLEDDMRRELAKPAAADAAIERAMKRGPDALRAEMDKQRGNRPRERKRGIVGTGPPKSWLEQQRKRREKKK